MRRRGRKKSWINFDFFFFFLYQIYTLFPFFKRNNCHAYIVQRRQFGLFTFSKQDFNNKDSDVLPIFAGIPRDKKPVERKGEQFSWTSRSQDLLTSNSRHHSPITLIRFRVIRSNYEYTSISRSTIIPRQITLRSNTLCLVNGDRDCIFYL